jgi:hypothetical protein
MLREHVVLVVVRLYTRFVCTSSRCMRKTSCSDVEWFIDRFIRLFYLPVVYQLYNWFM